MTSLLRCALSLVLCLTAAGAQAQSADFSAGQKRAAVCLACHGPHGYAKTPGVPHLAGQDRVYLENALRAYREGQQRQNPTMTAMARVLSDADIANLALFFASQSGAGR